MKYIITILITACIGFIGVQIWSPNNSTIAEIEDMSGISLPPDDDSGAIGETANDDDLQDNGSNIARAADDTDTQEDTREDYSDILEEYSNAEGSESRAHQILLKIIESNSAKRN